VGFPDFSKHDDDVGEAFTDLGDRFTDGGTTSFDRGSAVADEEPEKSASPPVRRA